MEKTLQARLDRAVGALPHGMGWAWGTPTPAERAARSASWLLCHGFWACPETYLGDAERRIQEVETAARAVEGVRP